MSKLFTVFIVSILSLVVASITLAEGPAVSQLNGKLETIGGSVDGENAKAAAISLTAPISERFGAQLDAAFGEIGESNVKGAGLHLFARDPKRYLLGINGIYADVEELSLEQYAIEGEYYWGPITLAALVGQQTGDLDHFAFTTTDIRWYPLDNFMLEAGGNFTDNHNKGHIGAEYQLVNGLSVFADFAAGDNEYEHALLGAKYYLGATKTLIQRHREDDPLNNILVSAIEGLASLNAAPAAAECATTITAEEFRFPFTHALGCGFTAEVDCNGIIVSIPDASSEPDIVDPTIYNGQSISAFGPAVFSGCFGF